METLRPGPCSFYRGIFKCFGGHGGGINNDGTLTINNSSSITGNVARCLFACVTHSVGGGINNYGTLTLSNSTVSGNDAIIGGGINGGSDRGFLSQLSCTKSKDTGRASVCVDLDCCVSAAAYTRSSDADGDGCLGRPCDFRDFKPTLPTRFKLTV